MTYHDYMNITSIIRKEKLRYVNLSAVILGLKVKLFLDKCIGFHYSFENFNDYLPFKCLMVV